MLKLYNQIFWLLSIVCLLSACSDKVTVPKPRNSPAKKIVKGLSDEALIDTIARRTFDYFWSGAEPNSGLARERLHLDNIYPTYDKDVVTTGGSGFGIMGLVAGIERGYITREQGIKRFERIINFLEEADRFHGAWPHWLNGKTGKVVPFGKKDNGGDLVETAFLVQGLLTLRAYLNKDNTDENKLINRITKMWEEVEWSWYQRGGQHVLYWHWSPEYAWDKNFAVKGYNECLIMYILAAASPTYPISPEVYHEGWAKSGEIKSDSKPYGLPLELHHNGSEKYGGPLFWAHYSYLGLDPRNLSDRYADYNKVTKNHALANYKYCVENPKNHYGYGPECWGLTASYNNTGYTGHSPKHDLGVISPTAALASFPYTPKESMQACRYFYEELGEDLLGPYGFYDAFVMRVGYFPHRYLAIDQGPIICMIENYQSGLLWDLFMGDSEIQSGLSKLDFKVEKN